MYKQDLALNNIQGFIYYISYEPTNYLTILLLNCISLSMLYLYVYWDRLEDDDLIKINYSN